MVAMPRVGEVFLAPKLQDAVLLCVDVTTSTFGTHYEFFVLDSGDLNGSQFRSWTEARLGGSYLYGFDSFSGVFGMTKAMNSFSFSRLA